MVSMAIPIQPLEYHSPNAVRPRSWFACNWWKVLSVIAAAIGIVAIVVIGVVVRYTTVLDRRLALARQHVALIAPAIASDPRFDDVEMEEFTYRQGCMMVSGSVDSSEALTALKAKILATSPPVDVYWAVGVLTSEQIERAKRLGLPKRRSTTSAITSK